MKLLIVAIGIIGLVFILAFVFSLPVMWLWNYLMPDLFGLKQIDWWHAFCISILSGILFKGGGTTSKSD